LSVGHPCLQSTTRNENKRIFNIKPSERPSNQLSEGLMKYGQPSHPPQTGAVIFSDDFTNIPDEKEAAEKIPFDSPNSVLIFNFLNSSFAFLSI
jgi:hypothetical protein